MSYCGACGGYVQGCPRQGQGECVPAPNPHEEKIANLIAVSVAGAAEVAAMVAENQWRTAHRQALAYGEEAFMRIADRIRAAIGDRP